METKFKETKIGRIPGDWKLLPFDDCVDKEGHTGEYRKLQTKDYLDEGRYPIIDQGQEFIAGYTNDENDVYTGSLPVTIFGDHTLFVKFVNMRFAIGADGTVLLYPNKNKLTDKFFYYLISNHKIKSEGYQRHVKYLRQKWFAIPPPAEQRKIAEILSTVDETIEKTHTIIQETQRLKKRLMQKLFTEGIGHTRFKETKIGRIPEEWDVATLGQILTRMQSGVSRNLSPVDIGIPVIRSTNIQGNRLVLNDLRYWYWDDPKGVDLSNYILDDGDILINFINSVAQIGKCCIFSGQARDFIFTTNIFRAKANNELVSNMYFLMFSQTATYQSQISSITKPAVNQASFTHGDFRKLKVPRPRKEEQDKIVRILSEVDSKTEKEQAFKSELEKLKKGLMQVLLTGKVRVKV